MHTPGRRGVHRFQSLKLEPLEPRLLLNGGPLAEGMLWGTFLGGNAWDLASAVALDGDGNIVVTGNTASPTFPTDNGLDTVLGTSGASTDAFVSKFDPTGQLLWSTYLGGSGNDYGNDITTLADGSVVVIGDTGSDDFPTTAGLDGTLGGDSDAFVAVLSTDGQQLLWATYLGGDAADVGGGVAVDAGGNLLITGTTASADFPTGTGGFDTVHNGDQDAFVAKLDAAGHVVWATFLGGSEADHGAAIAQHGGSIVVTGDTASGNFPTDGGFDALLGQDVDAFVARVAANGQLDWSTYLGGTGSGGWGETGYDVAIDSAGNALVAGETNSIDFPTDFGFDTLMNGTRDGFIAKISPACTLVWASFLGGNLGDGCYGIVVDSQDNAIVTGETSSTDFPTYGGSEPSGTSSAFVATVASGGTLTWSGCAGGSGTAGGWSVAVDGDDNPVVAGGTGSTDFPVGGAAFDTYGGGSSDGMVFKMVASTATGHYVTGHLPDGWAVAPVDHLDVTFSEPIIPATFTTDDVTLDGPSGPITIDSIGVVEGNTYRIGFAAQSTDGTYTLTLDPYVQNLVGTPMDQDRDGQAGEATDDRYQGSFFLRSTDLWVTEPADRGIVHDPPATLDVTFSWPIDPATFTAADVQITTPSGSLAALDIEHVQDNTYRVVFARQETPGGYTVRVGPHIESLSGHELNEDHDDTEGEGVDDAYVATVTYDPTLGPQILASVPGDGEAIEQDLLEFITVAFSTTIDPATFTAADVALVGPAGPVEVFGITQITDTVYWIAVPVLEEGDYDLTVGPDIADAASRLLNQDRDGLGGEPEDVHAISFTVAPPTNWAPFITTTSPVPYAMVPAGTVRLEWDGRDYEKDEVTYDVYVSDASTSPFDVAPLATGLTDDWLDVDLSAYEDQIARWGVAATDEHGASAQSTVRQLRVQGPATDLTLGVPLDVAGNASDRQVDYYQLAVPAGETVVVSLAHTGASTSFVVRAAFGRYPTSEDPAATFVPGVGEHRLVIPDTEAGIYTIEVIAQRGVPDHTLLAVTSAEAVVRATPTRAAATGLVTVSVWGVGFDDQTAFTLVGPGGAELTPVDQRLESDDLWRGGFDLTGAAAGAWDIEAEFGSGTIETLDNAIAVQATGEPRVFAHLHVPAITRTFRATPATLTYGNRGSADGVPSLIIADLPPGVFYRLSETAPWQAGPMILLAVSGEDVGGRLPPRTERRVTVELRSVVEIPQGTAGIGVRVVACDDPELATMTVDWAGWAQSTRPESVDETYWNAIWNEMGNQLGTTWDVLAGNLVDIAAAHAADDPFHLMPEAQDLRYLLSSPLHNALDAAEAVLAPGGGGAQALGGPVALGGASTEVGRTYVVIIGIEDYEYEGSKIYSLPNCYTEALKVYQYYRGIGVPREQIVCKLDAEDGSELYDMGLQDVRNAVTSFDGELGANDQLVVFYAGHGKRGGLHVPGGPRGEVYQYEDFLEDIDQGQGKTSLFLDCCHSGAIFDRPTDTWEDHAIVAGSSAARTVPDNYPIGDYFYPALSDTANDADGDGYVSWTEAFNASRPVCRQKVIDKNVYYAETLAAKSKAETEAKYVVGLTGPEKDAYVNAVVERVQWQNTMSNLAPETIQQGNVLPDPWDYYIEEIILDDWDDNADDDFDEWEEDWNDYSCLNSYDPNEKTGPAGLGQEGYIAGDPVAWPFEIAFENLPSASADAQIVHVTDTLDGDLNLESLDFGTITFGATTIDVPDGQWFYQAIVPCDHDESLAVQIELSYNPLTGQIDLLLEAVDAVTLGPPADPMAGFLPPNDADHAGEGSLTYTVEPEDSLPLGTQVTNQASIVFDLNPPILTNQTLNTIAEFQTHELTPGRRTNRVTFADAAGTDVTVKLGGKAGSAEVLRAIDANGNGSIARLTLDATTAKSTLTIKTPKGTETTLWQGIIHGSLKLLKAPSTDLLNGLAADGWVGKMQFDDVADDHTITIGGSADHKPVTLVFDQVADLGIASLTPIGTIACTEWLQSMDSETEVIEITAPSLARLVVTGRKAKPNKGITALAGDFEGSLNLGGNLGKARIAGSVTKGTWAIAGAIGSIVTGLDFCADLDALSVKSMSVKRNLDGATVNLTQAVDPKLKALGKLIVTGWTRDTAVTTAGHVAKFQTGGMDGSCLLLGVNGMDLPDDAADFKAQTLLKSFTVKGIKDGKIYVDSFIDSDVAAWCITKASLREVVTDNTGDAFGFAWCELKSLKWQDGGDKFRWPEKKPTDWPDDTGDFLATEVV